MARAAAIPPAPRKTLLEWIDQDDGNETGPALPACTAATRGLHARLCAPAEDRTDERIEPPVGLALAPLG